MGFNYCGECGALIDKVTVVVTADSPGTFVACDEGAPTVEWKTWTTGKENRVVITFHALGRKDRQLILTMEQARAVQDRLVDVLIDEKTSIVHAKR